MFGYAAPSTAYGPDVPPTGEDVAAVKRVTDINSLLDLAIAPRSPKQVATVPGGLERIARDVELARSLGVPVTMHTGLDTDADITTLADRGLLGPELTIIHANMLTESSFRRVAEAGGWVSVSPEVEMQMFGLPSPLRAMLRAGIRPTISGDLPASQRSDLFTQQKFLLQVQRLLDWQATGGPLTSLLPTADTLPYVTTNAAASLGMADRVGSLTPGKRGDVVVLNVRDANTLGVENPVSAALTYAHVGNVETVLVDGRVVKRDGQLVGVDEEELHRRVLDAQRRLLAEL